MATVKIKFRSSTVADVDGYIYYQIIHKRQVRQLVSGHRLRNSEWDSGRSSIIYPRNPERRRMVGIIRENIHSDIRRITKIISRLENASSRYTADDVVDTFRRYVSEYTLCSYMENLIARQRQNGKLRTSEIYRSTLTSFRKFMAAHQPGGTDIMLDSIDHETMEAYEAWHHSRGVTPNTISFYTRVLRDVYNRAVEDGAIENRHPFRHVYTGIGKTAKRALPISTLKTIRTLDLSAHRSLDYARDIFILSFMLRGMSFIDMAYLRKTDLSCGYIVYRRRKTGQLLTIKWTKDMQQILDKYPENRTGYLLPIIKTPGINERCAYRNAGYAINHNLKIVARMAGITIPLTLYVARHSWASAARAKGIPLNIISEGMGHDNETTTMIYLASLDTSAVDRANSKILASI